MERNRVRLDVYVDLDLTPGAFHTQESAQHHVSRILRDAIPHYNPMVSSGGPDQPGSLTRCAHTEAPLALWERDILEGGSTPIWYVSRYASGRDEVVIRRMGPAMGDQDPIDVWIADNGPLDKAIVDAIKDITQDETFDWNRAQVVLLTRDQVGQLPFDGMPYAAHYRVTIQNNNH